jgi:hydrogenase maturation protease
LSDAPHLVLGIGNELFRDEGVGVACARLVAERALPAVEVLDGGTLGIALVPAIEGRRSLLVLDAAAVDGASPGEVVVIDGDGLAGAGWRLCSTHQIGVLEALDAAALLGRAPERVAVVGMVPDSLDTGYGLSARAAERLDEMAERAIAVLARWGVKVASRA